MSKTILLKKIKSDFEISEIPLPEKSLLPYYGPLFTE